MPEKKMCLRRILHTLLHSSGMNVVTVGEVFEWCDMQQKNYT